MTDIKHLVLSGGGPLLFHTMGIIQQLEKSGIYNRSNIKSIYGTSSGAIIGFFVCLGYDWDIINNFMINRPWDNLYNLNAEKIFNSFKNCGFYGRDIFVKSYKSLFDAKDISIDITMKEFYELNNIDFHVISFEINNMTLENISHENYPDLKVIDALNMTSCLPIIFVPQCINSKCFIDGGIVLNYPLSLCIEKYKNQSEIFGIKYCYSNTTEKGDESTISNTSTLYDYVIYVIYKLIKNISVESNTIKIQNEILCNKKCMSLNSITSTIANSEKRKELLADGVETALKYITDLENG